MTVPADEDVRMADDGDVVEAPAPALSNKAKGKGKAVDGAPVPNEDLDLLPWVEKYRPVTMADLVSHEDVTSTLKRFVEKNRLPHLLFYGPPGTGKTSTIIALARRIYGDGFRNNVLELNASDDRGIDVVRDQIKSFASTRNVFANAVSGGNNPTPGSFKLIILDEADAMTQAAQGALRRVIEQYTKNVRFCIICNYVNKIIPAIQSRCTRFRFNPLEIDQVEGRLIHVIESESCNITPEGKEALLKLSRGDMRRALNVLQACHAAFDRIDEAAVYNCTGSPQPSDIEAMVNSMMTDEFTTAYTKITSIKIAKGLALADLITGIYDTLLTMKLPKPARIYLLDHIASTEHRLSTGGSEKIQLTALLGAVKVAVEIAAKEGGSK